MNPSDVSPSFPEIRIWRSPRSSFGGDLDPDPKTGLLDETITAEGVYDDAELARIAGEGFNGIWVHGVLHHLVSVDPLPELGGDALIHQAALNQLTLRAARHGLKIWLYMQPPRAVPKAWTSFWEKHPEIGGVEADARCGMQGPVPMRSLCTSTPKVRAWLTRAAVELAEKVPGLAGVILITASEFHSHCYTHQTRFEAAEWMPMITCPRCAQRDPEEVTAEVIAAIAEGLRPTGMKVVAWNWSWCWRGDSNERVIRQLPPEVIIMADFERGGVRDLPGKPRFLIDEYSLSYAGPSERFQRCAQAASERGMSILAKLQIGTTHELPSVVNLPILGTLYDKARRLTQVGAAGFMGCWNFGNHPSANTSGFHEFLQTATTLDRHEALEAFAAHYFPGCSPELVRRAWEVFEVALIYFPFTIAFLYHGPQAHTLAYQTIYHPGPLSGKPAGRSWMPDERGDDLHNSYQLHHTQFSLEEIIERLGKMASLWAQGVDLLRSGLETSSSKTAQLELGNAAICGAVWKSTLHSYRVYQARLNWSEATLPAFLGLAKSEAAVLREVLPWVKADPRQGVHLEPQYRMFGAELICQKLDHLAALS